MRELVRERAKAFDVRQRVAATSTHLRRHGFRSDSTVGTARPAQMPSSPRCSMKPPVATNHHCMMMLLDLPGGFLGRRTPIDAPVPIRGASTLQRAGSTGW